MKDFFSLSYFQPLLSFDTNFVSLLKLSRLTEVCKVFCSVWQIWLVESHSGRMQAYIETVAISDTSTFCEEENNPGTLQGILFILAYLFYFVPLIYLSNSPLHTLN